MDQEITKDTCCIPIYLVALGLFVSICIYAGTHRTEQVAWKARDYKWRACGEGENLAKPFLGSVHPKNWRGNMQYNMHCLASILDILGNLEVCLIAFVQAVWCPAILAR